MTIAMATCWNFQVWWSLFQQENTEHDNRNGNMLEFPGLMKFISPRKHWAWQSQWQHVGISRFDEVYFTKKTLSMTIAMATCWNFQVWWSLFHQENTEHDNRNGNMLEFPGLMKFISPRKHWAWQSQWQPVGISRFDEVYFTKKTLSMTIAMATCWNFQVWWSLFHQENTEHDNRNGNMLEFPGLMKFISPRKHWAWQSQWQHVGISRFDEVYFTKKTLSMTIAMATCWNFQVWWSLFHQENTEHDNRNGNMLEFPGLMKFISPFIRLLPFPMLQLLAVTKFHNFK